MYIAKDGREFESEYDCSYHEYELRQEKKEKDLSYLEHRVSDHEWPSIANISHKREYMWFKISSRDDLDKFCDCYKFWCTDLRNVDQVESYINYPDYICIVDYPKGGREADWYTLTEIIGKTNGFLDQFNYAVTAKI